MILSYYFAVGVSGGVLTSIPRDALIFSSVSALSIGRTAPIEMPSSVGGTAAMVSVEAGGVTSSCETVGAALL